MFQRYAIYYTPDAALAHLGAAWLGWDPVSGTEIEQPFLAGLDPRKLTQTPRKYGMHGTIKAPFHLRKNTTATELQDAFRLLCGKLAPVTLTGLEVAQMGRFIALVPEAPSARLTDLAAQVVSELDVYRAPLSDTDLARRRARPLSVAQEANLIKWGYPYVMEQFRFHITLTGRLDTAAEPVRKALRSYLDAALPRPFVVDSLTLMGQTDSGFFHEIERLHLKG